MAADTAEPPRANKAAQNKNRQRGCLCRHRKRWSEGLAARFLHVGSLRTFRSLHNLEFDHISFLQSAVAVSNDGRVVDEDIGPIVTPDKTVTFRVIEPFYSPTQA